MQNALEGSIDHSSSAMDIDDSITVFDTVTKEIDNLEQLLKTKQIPIANDLSVLIFNNVKWSFIYINLLYLFNRPIYHQK